MERILCYSASKIGLFDCLRELGDSGKSLRQEVQAFIPESVTLSHN